ncbi:MAG: hypothetical protein IH849_05195 [Acidobacteria bacterium]|nr:hypothetical protein [Acidobacteriota bacterium]
MRRRSAVAIAGCLAIILLGWTGVGAQQQLPMAPLSGSGRTVSPAYEGWYQNPDGTYNLSFGYYNRNTEEALEIPIGPDNSIEPAEFNGDQPTRFEPRRHWGVFTVTVPADFGNQRIEWTLNIRGRKVTIPGHLREEWKIDALEGEAGSGNTPPVLRFDMGGPEGAGPGGVTTGPLQAKVDEPLTVTVWAYDDGAGRSTASRAGRRPPSVTLTWFKHQGPGDVTFSEENARVPIAGGEAEMIATFSVAGDYVLRVRANDASGVSGAGHAQCCWTNGFVKVTVTQ